MIDINNFLNELGFEINENKVNRFLEKAGLRNNIMKSETVKGAFSKLSDVDKQSVIDTLNDTQAIFDNLFGTQSKKWTVEDLSDAYVDIRKPASASVQKEADNCGCNNCTCEKKAGKAEEKKVYSVADVLRKEIAAKKEEEKNAKIREVADAVVSKAVEKFSDTKTHQYTVESDADGNPIAYTNVRMLTPEGIEIASDKEFCNNVSKTITEQTGAKKTTIELMSLPNNTYLKIGLVL